MFNAQYRFEKVDQKEMMLGNEPILTYAPDQNGETKRIFKVLKDLETKSVDEKPAAKKAKKPKEEPMETPLPTPTKADLSTPTLKRNTRNTRSTTQATTTAPQRKAPKSAEYVEETDTDEEIQQDELTESDDENDRLGLYEDDIVNASDYEDKTPTKGGRKRKASTKIKDQKGSEGTAAKKAKSTPAAIPNVEKPAPPARSKSNPTSGDCRVHFSKQEAPVSISAAEFDHGGFTAMFGNRPTDPTTSTSTIPKAKAVAPGPTPSSSATPPAGATNSGAANTVATVGSAPNAPTTATPLTAAQSLPAPQALQQQQPPMPMPTPQMQQWMLQQQQQWMMNQMGQMNQMTPEQQMQQWQYMSRFMPQFMPQIGGGGGGGIQGGHGNAWGQFPAQPQGGAQ
ncbi:hypothetical protein PQX77_022357 [Marasmius sp. AFHP31]|nr:hypothetical protein PQX77_022357 [Marasmius sp. AFHP31]